MSIGKHAAMVLRVSVGALATAATCLVLIGQIGRWDQLLDQTNAFLSLLVPVLALLGALALRLRDRLSLAVAVLGLTLGGFQIGHAAMKASAGAPHTGEPEMSVLTLSTYHSNLAPDGIRAVVHAEKPDIAVLQETNGTAAKVVAGLLPGYQRIKSCNWARCPLTILSRWPMRRVQLRYRNKAKHPDMLLGEVDAPFGRFHIVNVHLPRPYQEMARAHLLTVAELARRETALPLIVAGDFNTATGSFGLARFTQTSGLLQREGLVLTYPANKALPAFAGIDHVFADRRWTGQACHRIDAGGSDHYGVACRLALQPIAERQPVR